MGSSPVDVQARYPVQLEVAGPLAMFARPDTGGTPTSYPVPTWSAAKGVFESIAFFSDGAAWICPTRVEICRVVGASRGGVRYQRYTTNYGGPLRKTNLMKKGSTSGGSSMQVFATVLSDVCYRLYGAVLGARSGGPVNTRHHLKELFERRLRRGQCFRVPRLGWSECTCSYWGAFREGVTEVDDAVSLEIPSMLIGMWDQPAHGQYHPSYGQNVRVVSGVLVYPAPSWLSESEREARGDAQ